MNAPGRTFLELSEAVPSDKPDLVVAADVLKRLLQVRAAKPRRFQAVPASRRLKNV
jgi:hypothetical protein